MNNLVGQIDGYILYASTSQFRLNSFGPYERLNRFEQCDQEKLPNVYKSCPKMISLEKWYILTPLHKFHFLVQIRFHEIPILRRTISSIEIST